MPITTKTDTKQNWVKGIYFLISPMQDNNTIVKIYEYLEKSSLDP